MPIDFEDIEANPNLPGKLVSDMEQLSAMMVGVADVVSDYYHSLIVMGVPEELVVDLVKEWHAMYFERVLLATGKQSE